MALTKQSSFTLNKSVALKALFPFVALAVEHVEVQFVLAVLADGKSDVQVRRVDGQPVGVVVPGPHDSHVHVTVHEVCHQLWTVYNYRCVRHVTRAIHLVCNDLLEDQPTVLHARDVRVVRRNELVDHQSRCPENGKDDSINLFQMTSIKVKRIQSIGKREIYLSTRSNVAWTEQRLSTC